MSDVELSRRAARAFQSPVISNLDSGQRLELARRIDRAANWNDLSDKDRKLILRAEKHDPGDKHAMQVRSD